jgi:tetratricopeptide (TPR) repeat protein
MPSSQWVFDRFRLDPDHVCLWRGAEVLALPPKAFDLLHYFVTHPDRVLTKDELLDAVWPQTAVTEAVVGEAGVGKSRLVDEFVQAAHTAGWLVLDSAAVSYGQATPYFPVLDLLRRYCHLEEGEDAGIIQAKVTEQLLTLDAALHDTIPALLALLDALPADSPFLQLDAPQRRQHTFAALKRVLLRESQVHPVLLVCEDLHWLDTETQALLESLGESLPTARLLLLVNYRPDYRHGWGSKTYYTQVRLDPLPPASADAFLQALLGDDLSLLPLNQLLIQRTEGNPFFLEEAHTLAARALALARECQESSHQAYALRLLGQLAARRDSPEIAQAAAHYRQALALADELGMRPLQAHCHRGLGTLYAATGQREQARAELSAAIALYRTMEMTLWLPQAEAVLAQVEATSAPQAG